MRVVAYSRLIDTPKVPHLFWTVLIAVVLFIHAGCGTSHSTETPRSHVSRQDPKIPQLAIPQATDAMFIDTVIRDVPKRVDTDVTTGKTTVLNLPVDQTLVDSPISDSARSSVSSVSSLWGTDPSEELMNEVPPCGTFPVRPYSGPSISDKSKIDFRIRMVDFNTASELNGILDSQRRLWRTSHPDCSSTPTSFSLVACGPSVEFVIDDQKLNPVHARVHEHRAIAPGRNKVTVKFFESNDDLLERAATEVAALSILGDRVSPTLFDSSIPPVCRSFVHSYHGYHALGDLRGVATIPSANLLLRIAVRGLELVRDMHQVGLVHGSINLRTLRYRKTPKITNEDEIVSSLRLVDFWISSRLYVDVARRGLAADPPSNSEYQPVAYMSVFQLEAMMASSPVPSPTRRDDVLGLAESLLMLAIGDYDIFELSDPYEILSRKRNLGFQAPGRVDSRLYSFYKRAREMERGAVFNYEEMIVSLR